MSKIPLLTWSPSLLWKPACKEGILAPLTPTPQPLLCAGLEGLGGGRRPWPCPHRPLIQPGPDAEHQDWLGTERGDSFQKLGIIKTIYKVNDSRQESDEMDCTASLVWVRDSAFYFAAAFVRLKYFGLLTKCAFLHLGKGCVDLAIKECSPVWLFQVQGKNGWKVWGLWLCSSALNWQIHSV